MNKYILKIMFCRDYFTRSGSRRVAKYMEESDQQSIQLKQCHNALLTICPENFANLLDPPLFTLYVSKRKKFVSPVRKFANDYQVCSFKKFFVKFNSRENYFP